MSEKPAFLTIGRILRPWGVRGEVKAQILTDFPERLESLETVLIGEETRPFRVERARLHSGTLLLKLAGYDTPEAVDALRDQELKVPLAEAATLRENQYFHHDIVGLQVRSEAGEALGEVSEILGTGANDVYVVLTPRGRELLLPAIREVVRKIDLERGEMIVRLLPGMEE